jgi:hypothetical protein
VTGPHPPPVPIFVPRWLGATRNRMHTLLAEERWWTGRNNVPSSCFMLARSAVVKTMIYLE